jgi:hypothetical protein
MNKQFWLEIAGMFVKHYASTKMLSKQLAKAVVLNVLKLSGPVGYITGLILAKVIEYGLVELKDLEQKFKDHKTLKEFKEELPNGNTEKRKELEEDILSGR